MRLAAVIAFALAALVSAHGFAESKPPIAVAGDGFPAGPESPEGAAADLARAFIDKDPQAFRNSSVRVYSQGASREEYEAFLSQVASSLAEEKIRTEPSPGGPKAIAQVFAARHFGGNGPASYGYASFGFQDVAFVDVGVALQDDRRAVNRTLVIKDRDGKWYAHPAPHISPLLGRGMNREPPSRLDFSDVYQPGK